MGPEPPPAPPSTVIYEAARDRSCEPSCFDVLGIDAITPADEIKRRFRELAKRYHPDRGGRQEDFVAINHAYVQALRLLLDVA